MASISISNWKQVDIDGTAFEFIEPEYHPTYWEIPKWWYKGDTSVYTSCVRVDLDSVTSIYIDGTTPLMQITLEWDGSSLKATNYRDIDRVMICASNNLGPINRDESDDYTDIEFFKDYYIVRVINYTPAPVIEPLIKVLKPQFYSELPVAAGSTAPFDTGTWNGGVEPITYEWRYKAQDYESDVWYSVGDYTPQPNEAVQTTLILSEESSAWYIHIESRAVDGEGTVVYNNSGSRRAIPRIQKKPGTKVEYLNDRNTYESGTELYFKTAEFIGGIPPVSYRYRIQQRMLPEDAWTSGEWTYYDNTIITDSRTITFPAGAQVRILCQGHDSSESGSKNIYSGGAVKTIL
jgi:hypothetical protein